MFESRSALANALEKGGRDGADGKRRCRLGELRGQVLLQVAGFPATIAEVERALLPVLGVALPQTLRDTVAVGGGRVFRTGPEQFWIVGPSNDGDGAEAQLRQVIPAAIGAVTSLSHSRTRIVIDGACARDVLRKAIPLDFDPDVFRVGEAALTGLHHTPILIHRAGADRYELYAMRSFALSVWEWLTDAALEYGYDIAGFNAAP
ncbi:MAG TPA: sarcosine oxidase subunit gamma family protein [Candidatus Acidoferrum sp.]|nr:sarcosine oxidase subunit gamma family protein [Candidatus Acidoferrum sp.]